MQAPEYNEMRMEESNSLIQHVFHVYLPVNKLIFDDIETAPNSYAVLFTSGKDTYALLIAENGQKQTLGDARCIIKGMGLEAQRFFPPGADPQYFYEEGVKHFLKAYPGRKHWQPEEVRFYESLASYNPALVRLSAINGAVRRFNIHTHTWQDAFKYSFRKIHVAS